MTVIVCFSADAPRGGFHHQVRHPRGHSLAHHWSLVVQDKHLVLADFRHKVKMLLLTQTNEIREALEHPRDTSEQ